MQHDSASWGVADKQASLPAHFPGRWHKGVLPYNRLPRWIAAAPLLATPVPSARLIADQPDGAGRRVRLELSRGGADALAIRFPEKAKLLAVGLPEGPIAIPAKGEPDKALLRCAGRSCDGLVIEAVLADRAPDRRRAVFNAVQASAARPPAGGREAGKCDSPIFARPGDHADPHQALTLGLSLL